MSEDRVLENKFKNRLKKETNEVTRLKEEVWNNISHELFRSNMKHTRTSWLKGLVATLGTVAVAAIMFFGLLSGNFTDQTKDDPIQEDPVENDPTQGTNDPDTIGDQDRDDNTENDPGDTEQEIPLQDQFEQEKEVEIEVEGSPETIQVQLATNDAWGYIIYFDKNRFEFIQGEEMDKIISTKDPDDRYPEVGIEIQKMTDITIEDAIANVKELLASDEMSIIREEEIDRPIDGLMIVGEGNENGVVDWDTPIHSYYITEGKNDSLFVFKHISFVEAGDGGPRFYYMLESFEIVE